MAAVRPAFYFCRKFKDDYQNALEILDPDDNPRVNNQKKVYFHRKIELKNENLAARLASSHLIFPARRWNLNSFQSF